MRIKPTTTNFLPQLQGERSSLGLIEALDRAENQQSLSLVSTALLENVTFLSVEELFLGIVCLVEKGKSFGLREIDHLTCIIFVLADPFFQRTPSPDNRAEPQHVVTTPFITYQHARDELMKKLRENKQTSFHTPL